MLAFDSIASMVGASDSARGAGADSSAAGEDHVRFEDRWMVVSLCDE
jgi:hypothetical protein